MPQLVRFASLGISLAVVACQSKPTPSASGVVSSAAVEARASAVRSASAAPSGAAPSNVTGGLAEGEVRAFVERWQAAQNAGDFAAYSRLYAERFMGVKRVGSYSKRFERAGWLADRKPMLAGGAQVKVTDVELVAVAGATRAVFTQEFSSGTFRDVGKKELFLVAAPGGIVITKEEMLDSKVSEPAEAAAATGQVLAFHRDGVVVERGFDKQKLAGRPRLLTTKDATPLELGFSVAPEALGAGARGWLGREVTAYSSDGKSCTGKVSRFEVRVQAVPHFGMRQAWNGEGDEPKKATPEEIAASLEGMAQSSEHFVVGVLDQACSGSWASAGPAVPFTAARAATGALRGVGVAAFRALPAYVELQQRFVKETKTAGRGWEEGDGLLKVMELQVPNRPALLLVTARTNGGCADFSGALSAFWNVEGTPTAPKLVSLASSFGAYITLRGALDQGAAGLSLLAGPDDFDDELSVLRLSPRVSRRVLLATAVWDCLC